MCFETTHPEKFFLPPKELGPVFTCRVQSYVRTEEGRKKADGHARGLRENWDSAARLASAHTTQRCSSEKIN
jgi:hypothetical protein